MLAQGTRAATILLVLGLSALTVPGRAASTGKSRYVEVALVPEDQSVAPGKPFRVGLRMRIADGWHTYWKNPGDAGLPARLKWTLPEGFTAGPIQWPTPDRIPAPPLMSYGYEREVLLPVEITAPRNLSGKDVTLAVKADWLECKEACLPGKAELDLTLPVSRETPKPGEHAPLFAEARRRLPTPPTGWSLSAEAGPRALALTFRPAEGTPAESAYFFAEDAKLTEHAVPQGFEPLGDGYRVTLKPAPNAPGRPGRLKGVLVVEGGERPRAVQVDVAVAAGDPAPAPSYAAPRSLGSRHVNTLRLALGFAFVGGLILNLMPCVLPVLSLKVMGFVRHANGERGHAWRHGLVFTVGVVVCFWLLAGALLLLRAGGQKVGWGFQLQSLPFLVVLAGLFLLLGLNLFGVFEIGGSLTGAGNLLTGKSGLAHSFWNGVLATVVATPCTAPFMGSALGFGLSQPPLKALAVFTALGLGMATPYLLLSIVPGLLRFVPKPGPWMEGFRQLMGFFLLATVAALVWLFGQQAGVDGMGVLLAALLLTAFGAWIYGRKSPTPRGQVLRTVMALGLMAAGLGVGLVRALEPGPGRPGLVPRPNAASGLEWQEYSAARLAELRAKGTPVFLDFTAAWCLTCQVNERVSLAHSEVVERFKREGIVALRADWTRHDDHITEAIQSYGRQGVPVYVLYGRDPSAPARVLPELLTPGMVLSAIDESLGTPTTADASSR